MCGIVTGGRATYSGHETRNGSAGRGTSACVCVVVGGSATDSGIEKRNGSAGRGNPSNGRLVLHREWAS